MRLCSLREGLTRLKRLKREGSALFIGSACLSSYSQNYSIVA